ncbi:MAG: hypothetical protein QW521_02195 [Desulfurococcaceae archaeon]
MISREAEEYIRREILRKANVIGYSRRLRKKITGGVKTDIDCIVIYVSKKLPLNLLRAEDVIPAEIMGIKTDVIEIGEIKFLQADKTRKFRPLKMGISVGCYTITAGTIGWMFERNGEVYLGSNAHVLVDDPTKEPSEVKERRIVQPGRYDGGTLNDVIGELAWYRRIITSNALSTCSLTRAICSTYNFLARLFRRRTRLMPIVVETNRIDFAVARVNVDYELRFPDFDNSGYSFIGLGFAGSDSVSCVCRAKYILAEGYRPLDVASTDVIEGEIVEKSGRTSCHTKAKVIDDSATVKVGYGSYEYAVFEDIILTEKLLEPGDSGSSVWVKR